MTVADVQRVARTYFRRNRLVLTLLPAGKAGRNDEPGFTRTEHARAATQGHEDPEFLCGSSVSVVFLSLCLAPSSVGLAEAQTSCGRPNARHSRCRRATSSSRSYDLDMQWLQVVAVLHHEHPAVTMRLLIRTGHRGGPKDKLGWHTWAAARSGQDHQPHRT